jgi:hypothetical protein
MKTVKQLHQKQVEQGWLMAEIVTFLAPFKRNPTRCAGVREAES